MGRTFWSVGFGLLTLASLAQGSPENDPEKVAPQVIVNVRKHQMGADMIEVTAASATYPKALLQSQCERMGQLLQSPARGLAVYESGTEPRFKFIKASFATDGLVDRDHGTINLEAVVKAFLGAPAPHAVRSLLVTLEGEVPVGKQTLQDFSSDTVRLKANVSTFPKGLEYRILALTQDAEKISIPGRYVEPKAPEKPSLKKPSGTPGWLPAALLGVAGLAGGALVYFALSGRGRSAQGPSNRRT